MSNIQDRRIGEDAAQPDATKEKGTTPFETAPRGNHTRNSTERPLYLPLTWRDDTLVPNQIAYRVNGRLAGLLVLALVAGALLVGVLQ